MFQNFGKSDFISLEGDHIPDAKLGKFDKSLSCPGNCTKGGLIFTMDYAGKSLKALDHTSFIYEMKVYKTFSIIYVHALFYMV